MNVGRTVRRTIRPLWIAGLAATVWVNRAGVRSALGFGKKAPDGRGPSLDGAALDGPSLSLPAAGDTVTVRSTVSDIYDKKNGALEFIVKTARAVNQRDELVAELRTVLVCRH